MEFQMSWYPTMDLSLLVRNLLSSWRTTTSNTQHPVLTTRKQMGKQKELYKLYKALLDYRNSPLHTGFSPGQMAEENVTHNIQTPITRTWQFQGAEAEILLRQECERKPVNISSRWASHDEVRGHLEESWSSDSSLDSQILCSQRWA